MRKENLKLTFYMKSGNSFTIDNVEEYKVSGGGGTITGIFLTQNKKDNSNYLIVQSLNLDFIEAIIVNR